MSIELIIVLTAVLTVGLALAGVFPAICALRPRLAHWEWESLLSEVERIITEMESSDFRSPRIKCVSFWWPGRIIDSTIIVVWILWRFVELFGRRSSADDGRGDRQLLCNSCDCNRALREDLASQAARNGSCCTLDSTHRTRSAAYSLSLGRILRLADERLQAGLFTITLCPSYGKRVRIGNAYSAT